MSVEPAADLSESVDSTIESYDNICVGGTITLTKTFTEAEVENFAAISADTNPLHLSPEYASETRFGGRIVHGMLVAGTISAALAQMPGVVVYLSQDLKFLAPVRIGDTVTATVEIVERVGDDRYRLRTTVDTDADEQVVDGEAIVLIDEE